MLSSMAACKRGMSCAVKTCRVGWFWELFVYCILGRACQANADVTVTDLREGLCETRHDCGKNESIEGTLFYELCEGL